MNKCYLSKINLCWIQISSYTWRLHVTIDPSGPSTPIYQRAGGLNIPLDKMYNCLFYAMFNFFTLTLGFDGIIDKRNILLADRATVACISEGKHSWYFNYNITVSFAKKETGDWHGESVNDYVSYLHIEKFRENNTGYYSCFVDGVERCKFHLIVEDRHQLVSSVKLLGSSIIMKCMYNGSTQIKPLWYFNTDLLYAPDISPSDIKLDNVYGINVSDTASDLRVEPIKIQNSGNYSCKFGKTTWTTYQLSVQGYQLKINGEIMEMNNTFIEAFKVNRIWCGSNMSGELVDMELKVNVVDIDGNNIDNGYWGIHPDVHVAEKSLSLPATAASAVISCVINSTSGFEIEKKSLFPTIIVVPELRIQIDGTNVSDDKVIVGGKTITIKCVAFRSRPPVTLQWHGLFDDSSNHSENNSRREVSRVNYFHQYTKDYEIQEIVTVTGYMDISCYSDGEPGILKQSVRITIRLRGAYLLPIIISVSGFMLFVVLCVVMVSRRRKLRVRTTMSTSSRTLQSVNHVAEPCMSTCLYAASSEMMSTIIAQGHTEDSISRSTVSLLSLIASGEVFDYWKARIAQAPQNEYVVAKTVSERAQMKDGYNFVTMAKCIRRLEKHPNIVEFLGCSIDEVPYFVYQENMDNGTLRDFLLKNYQQQRHSMLEYPSGTAFPRKLQQPTVFGNDVAKAMHFLHKNERDPPLAWLPPETIFLGQYNLSADIWSYGVFLWELFSFGEVPYHSRDKREIEDAVRNMECLSRPPFCPGAIFGIMLSTWKRYREDRPQMSEITQHLEKTCMTFQKTKHDEYSDLIRGSFIIKTRKLFNRDDNHTRGRCCFKLLF
ncbi:uncharacterized protein [Apostichopus japonicus]|uniref:uncharacterized protein isoform X3 n=1 Tax=Stichopus japonicus TaxID=307972 RepID=UPI003AB39BC3